MSNATMLSSMLLASSPLLLAYIIALVVAVVFWSDFPQTCALVLGAALVLLLMTFIQPIIQQQLYNAMRRQGTSMQNYGQLVSAVAIVANIFRAGGIGLLVWAAFTGRTSAVTPASAFPTLPPRIPGPPIGR